MEQCLNIAELKVWHWTLICGIVGGLLAFAGPGPSRNRSADKMRTISQRDFEEAILAPSAPVAGAESRLTNIVIHPKLGLQGYWVTGSWTHPIRVHADPADHRSRLVDAEMIQRIKFLAGDPYRPIDPKLAGGKKGKCLCSARSRGATRRRETRVSICLGGAADADGGALDAWLDGPGRRRLAGRSWIPRWGGVRAGE
jgi:hypothetical protein